MVFRRGKGKETDLKLDTAALKLLRCQALSDIREGRLKPSQEEIEKSTILVPSWLNTKLLALCTR